MIQNSFIRRSLAGLMLMIFAFSVTPRQVLHDLFANHKDSCWPASKECSNAAQLQKAGFNCQCTNLVVENPFVENPVKAGFTPALFFPENIFLHTADIYSASSPVCSLRGPPASV